MAEKNDNLELAVVRNNRKATPNRYAELINRYFRLIVLVVSLLVLVLGYFMLIAPQWELKTDREQEALKREREVARLRADSEFLSRYSTKLIDFTPEEERKLSLALPDEFDLSSVVVQLSRLAGAHQFVIDSIQANEVGVSGLKHDRVKRVDLEMTVSGVAGNDYGNFAKFIEALENSLLIFDVKAINFGPQESGYDLELSTYYYAALK